MANDKLSPSLFYAKAGITLGAPRFLHFLASVQENRNLFTFVCESQPLLTLANYGLPKRCPFCGQDNPIGGEIQ